LFANHAHNNIQYNMKKQTYLEPQVQVLMLSVETVLCGSGNLNIDPPVDPWASSVMNNPLLLVDDPFNL